MMKKFKPMDAFEIHRSMMTITGIWPKNDPDLIYRLKTFVSWFMCFSMMIMMLIQVVHVGTDFTKQSEILYILATYVAYAFKLTFFTYYHKHFADMLESLKNPVFTTYSDDFNHYMARATRVTRIIATLYQYSVLVLVLLYLVYPILDHVALPFPIPYDFAKYTPLVYAYQLLGEAYAAWNNSTIDILSFALMSVAAAQLDVLAAKIVHFKIEIDGQTNEGRLEGDESLSYLKDCVKHHLAIIKFVESIEIVFTTGLLAQFVASAIIICNTLFYFVLIPLSLEFAMLADYFVVIVWQLFMYCWHGNKIILKSLQIRDACYMSNWHLCNNDVRKYMFIIMERSKRPLKITTLKFSTLSLAGFLAILQWSYSLLTLLLKMYAKRSATAS